MEFPRPRTSGSAAPRRVFTAPVPPSAPQSAASAQPAGGLVDTLYDHPNVKIVSFNAGSRSLSVGPRTAAVPDVEPGSLSWSSQLERTIAVGPFRIYRAPGSVAFLSCGSALQPILPKSQVWCVDEDSSKFVLQIRRPQYWRIEVPVGEEEEVRQAQQLRDVFDAILQFEKTECPFARSFTVELPERPQTPVKRRAWTPARRSSASLPLTPSTPVEIARLHEGTPRGSICMGDLRTALDARRGLNEHARYLPPVEEPASTESDQLGAGRRVGGPSRLNPLRVQRSMGSLVAPRPQVPLIALPRPRTREAGPAVPAGAPKFKSNSESLESLQGRESWISAPLPPSPPLSTPGSPRSSSAQLQTQVPGIADTQQGTRDHTVTTKPSQTWSVATADSVPASECSATTAPSSVHDPDYSSPCDQPQANPAEQTVASTTEPERITESEIPTAEPELPAEPSTPLKTTSPDPTPSASPSPSTRGRRPPIRRATTSSSTTSSSISPSRRALSPLPPAANLLTPPRLTTPALAQPTTTTAPSQTHRNPPNKHPKTSPTPRPNPRNNGTSPNPGAGAALTTIRNLPLTVLAKTCEILMSPPSHLLSLMLNVAARIAAGEWKGFVFGRGEGGEALSVVWDLEGSDDDYGGGGGRGWASGFGGGNNNNGGGGVGGGDDFWTRGRRTTSGMGGKLKMAGAFPESDEEEEEEEEEEALGPWDQPSRSRDRSISPGRREEADAPAEKEAPTTTTDKDGGRDKGPDSDAEWGVD